MSKWVHRLSEKNTRKKTAICAKCGLVKISKNSLGVWECSIRKKEGTHCRYIRHKHKRLSANYTCEIPKEIIQFGVCPICETEKKLVIDHDHKANKFRDFICINCNAMLGHAYDNPSILLAGATYLKRF